MARYVNGLYVNTNDSDFKNAINGTDLPERVKGRVVKAAAADISHISQQYFNPFTQVSTMEIPKDRRKINAWCRYFFESEPLVHAALTLHTEFPLSSIYIRHEDPEIQEFLEYMVDELDLFEFMMSAALEYWVIGEFCFVPGTLITMADRSQKPIEQVNTDDKIISHSGMARRVLCTMSRPVSEEIYQIYINKSEVPLEVTGNHPIRVYDDGKVLWRDASKLVVGDALSNGNVTKITKRHYDGYVYNLEVEHDHTYIANGTTVHNCAFGIFDDPDDPQMWEKFILLDPDYVDVYSVPMARGKNSTRMNLLPNPMLKRIIENGPADPNTGDLYDQIPSDVIAYVKQNVPMPLDPTCASYVKILGNPHNERATPLLMSCFKMLMYKDKLRSAQYAIADRHITPKEFYMIGEPGDPASQEEIEAFRDTLMATWTQPNQAIVYHHALQIRWEGAQGRMLPLQAEFDDVEKHILAGLMTSRAFLHGEGPTYASSSIALDVLVQRYLFFRRKMEQWLIRHVFRPIMELHGMYKPEQSELNNRYRIKRKRVPWDPEIQWEKQNLRDDTAKAQLLQALYDKGLIPAEHLLKFHNIDPDIAARGIEKERGTVFDKNAKNGAPMPGMPPMPPGGGSELPPNAGGIAPNAGGLDLPIGGMGGKDMSGLPIEGPNPVMPEESSAPVDLPNAI